MKGLQKSDASRRRDVIIRLVCDAVRRPPEGLPGMLSVDPAPARIDALAFPVLDMPAAWAYAQELAAAVRRAVDARREDQVRFDLGELGWAEITRWPFPLHIDGGHEDLDRELNRLRFRVRDAARQLAVPGMPGIVVVDLTRHSLRVGAHRQDLAAMLHDDPAYQHVAAVLLHTSFVREHIPTRRLHVVAGPAFGEIPEEFWSPFTLCEHETHLHFEPMREPGLPYECHPW